MVPYEKRWKNVHIDSQNIHISGRPSNYITFGMIGVVTGSDAGNIEAGIAEQVFLGDGYSRLTRG